MKNKIILHPILFSIYPALALFAANLNEVPFSEVWRSLPVSLLAGLLVWLILWLMVKDAPKAALLTTLLLVLFFSYGHVYTLAKTWQIGGLALGRHRYLLAAAGIFLLLAGWWIYKRSSSIQEVSSLLNWVGAAVLLFPLYAVASYFLFPGSLDLSALSQDSTGPNVTLEDPPDIYYIILDAYGRDDVLAELYDYDNSDLLFFLRNNGFYVAEQGHSNYARTANSLASSLNMTYVNFLGETFSETNDMRPLKEMLNQNLVFELLKQRGYQIVSFESGYWNTEFTHVDHYLAHEEDVASLTGNTTGVSLLGGALRFNKFEALLLESTLARVVMGTPAFQQTRIQYAVIGPEFEARRNRILFAFDHLADFAGAEGSYFVFAHLLTPHPPFVFGPNGEKTQTAWYRGFFDLNDGSRFEGTREEYLAGYRDQVTYTNKLLKIAIAEILEKSEQPPIIIIQGDHGPGAYLIWESPEETNMDERLSILNAYYFPGQDYSQLYETITPVNTFRIVFNQYFGGSYELLEDRSYFSPWETPYDFIEVTERLQGR
jgi:hypothetical protein